MLHYTIVTKQFKKAQIVKHKTKTILSLALLKSKNRFGNKLYISWLFGFSMTRQW
jgi:hypothetical protein